jgi:pimeloyl-ACP methyl ester carboxylesterase
VRAPDERGHAFLVPGNDLAAAFYRPLAGELAQRGVTTTLSTLPGFLDVPGFAEPTWELYAAALERALEASGAKGGLLLGHSLGGLLAFLALARSPDLARGLVLLEPFLLPWRSLARVAARTYAQQVLSTPEAGFKNWTGSYRRVHDLEGFPPWAIEHYEEVRRATNPAPAAALFASLEALYPLPFASVACPVLILRGANTGWRNALAHRLLRRSFPNARLEVIPGAAHWLANEQDALVAERVSRVSWLS